jgi:uncharacterized protein YjbI with pentapeptide repeats
MLPYSPSSTRALPPSNSSALCECNLFTAQGDFVHRKKTPVLIEKALTSGEADTQSDVQEVFSQAEQHVNSRHHLVMIMALITKKGGTVYLDGVTVNDFEMSDVTLRISARKATFNNLNCTRCNFPEIDLTEATFNRGTLNKVSLENGKLVDTLFVELHCLDVYVPGMLTNIKELTDDCSESIYMSAKKNPTMMSTFTLGLSPKEHTLSTESSQFSRIFYTLPATAEGTSSEFANPGPIIQTSATPCTDEELGKLVPSFPGIVVDLVQQYARSLEPPQSEKHKNDNCIIA